MDMPIFEASVKQQVNEKEAIRCHRKFRRHEKTSRRGDEISGARVTELAYTYISLVPRPSRAFRVRAWVRGYTYIWHAVIMWHAVHNKNR